VSVSLWRSLFIFLFSPILLFCYFVILLFCYFVILLFCYFVILLFCCCVCVCVCVRLLLSSVGFLGGEDQWKCSCLTMQVPSGTWAAFFSSGNRYERRMNVSKIMKKKKKIVERISNSPKSCCNISIWPQAAQLQDRIKSCGCFKTPPHRRNH